MKAKYAVSLIALTAVLALLFINSRHPLVQVATPHPPLPAEPAALPSPDRTPPLPQPALTLHPQTGLHTDPPAGTHQHDSSEPLPANIRLYIEQQRRPRTELVPHPHPQGGQLTNLQGQYQTVTVAVTGADGKVRLLERRIDPVPQAPAVPTAEPPASAD